MSSTTKIRLKLENAERSKKVGIIASSLQEVIQKAKEKGFVKDDADCTVVLGSNTSTQIADDNYLLALEQDTAVIVLSRLQHCNIERISLDEHDSSTSEKLSWVIVLKKIAVNIGYIVLLTEEELEVVADEDDLWDLVKENSGLRHVWSQKEIEEIQEYCQNLLDSKRRVNEAIQLIQLYQKMCDQPITKSAKKPSLHGTSRNIPARCQRFQQSTNCHEPFDQDLSLDIVMPKKNISYPKWPHCTTDESVYYQSAPSPKHLILCM